MVVIAKTAINCNRTILKKLASNVSQFLLLFVQFFIKEEKVVLERSCVADGSTDTNNQMPINSKCYN